MDSDLPGARFNVTLRTCFPEERQMETLANVGTFDKTRQFAFLASDGPMETFRNPLSGGRLGLKLVLCYDRVRNGCSYR